MEKLKNQHQVFEPSALKNIGPTEKIIESHGVKYLLTPIFKPIINKYGSYKMFSGKFSIQYLSGETDTLDFRSVADSDNYIIVGKTNRSGTVNNKNITNILINADNLDTTSLYGNQTYNLTIENYGQKKIFALQRNFNSFMERNKQNIESINFKGFGENYFSYFLKTCNDFGVDYSIYIEPEKAESVPTITK